jgi:hypothetical protein
LFSHTQAATITVNSNADAGGSCPGPTCTLRRAIQQAAFFDTIDFAPNITVIELLSDKLLIQKPLTIAGPGANRLTIRRGETGDFPIFHMAPDGTIPVRSATIAGLTISGGTLQGGIFNEGTLIIANSIISGNSATVIGGGVSNADTGNLTITNSAIVGNTVGNISSDFPAVGGGIYSVGTLTITNCTISGNTTATSGGNTAGGGIAARLSGNTMITNSTVSENTAGTGGGIWNEASSTVTAKNTIIALNTATDFAGTLTSQGYNIIGNTSGTNIIGTTTGNQPNVNPMLGPLQNNGGPTFTHALLSNSTAIDKGHSSGSVTDQRGFTRPVDSNLIVNPGDGGDIGAYEVQADQLPGCNTIVKNTDDSGPDSLRGVIASVCAGSTITFAPSVRGAILTSSELLLNKSLTISGPGANLLSVQRNAAAGNFRIFNIASASVMATISGVTISNGHPSGFSFGGGISNLGTLTLTNAAVSGNMATIGGGIFNDGGAVTLTRSTISGNSGDIGGAGIQTNGGTVSATNSTISGNMALGGNGGGFINSGAATSFTNSTIAGNSATGAGGGVHNFSGTVTSKNTIVALNTAGGGPDFNGTLTSQGYNLIGKADGSTGFTAATDQTGTIASPLDPKLDPAGLQNNGGPTQTIALQLGSPAIDKGNSSGSFLDQRGFTRPVGSATVSGGDGGDIGAYEFGGTPIRITSIIRLTSQHIMLEAQGVPNAAHTLQVLPDLIPGSTPIPVSVNANGSGLIQYDDAGAVGLTKRFYRLSFP